MKSAVDEARRKGTAVRAIVFINPGNPTGQCLSKDNLAELIKFAYDEKLVLMADEVYQENIYQVGVSPTLSPSLILLVCAYDEKLVLLADDVYQEDIHQVQAHVWLGHLPLSSHGASVRYASSACIGGIPRRIIC